MVFNRSLSYLVLYCCLVFSSTAYTAQTWCTTTAHKSAYQAHGGYTAWFAHLEYPKQTFIIREQSDFIEDDAGNAVFAAILVDTTDSEKRWRLELNLSGLIRPSFQEGIGWVHPVMDTDPSPKRELVAKVYTDAGGTIDANTWHYYSTFQGRLIGEGAYTGALINLQRLGAAFQIGAGANNKNLQTGGYGRFSFQIEQQPSSGAQLAVSHGALHFDFTACNTQCKTIYAVNDEGLNNTQLFTIDVAHNRQVNALGGALDGYDLESLDMSPTGELYAMSGDDATAVASGHLFLINKTTGVVIDKGQIRDVVTQNTYAEISSISFHPNGELWGWAYGKGLIKIDPTTAQATLIVEGGNILLEDITWDRTGQLLYGIIDSNVFAFNPNTNTVDLACQQVLPARFAAIESHISRDHLIFTTERRQDILLHEFDPIQCRIITTTLLSAIYNDIEGLAWGCTQ